MQLRWGKRVKEEFSICFHWSIGSVFVTFESVQWYFLSSLVDPRIDKVPLVTGTEGKMTISQAAAKIDPIAYPKLTAKRGCDRAVRQCHIQRSVV